MPSASHLPLQPPHRAPAELSQLQKSGTEQAVLDWAKSLLHGTWRYLLQGCCCCCQAHEGHGPALVCSSCMHQILNTSVMELTLGGQVSGRDRMYRPVASGVIAARIWALATSATSTRQLRNRSPVPSTMLCIQSASQKLLAGTGSSMTLSAVHDLRYVLRSHNHDAWERFVQ